MAITTSITTLSIIVATFFSTYATAQVTTSVWLPGAADTNQSFVGSIIAQNADHTTLSLAFADGPARTLGYYTSPPKTVTLGGTSMVAYQVTGVDKGSNDEPAVTISVGCSRAATTVFPTCTMSTLGMEAAISALCAGLTQPAGYCTDPNALTFDSTVTLNGGTQHYLNNFQLVITGGVQKMAVNAVATTTTTASGASITTSASPRTTSGSETRSTAAGSAPSQTVGGSSNSGAQRVGFVAASVWPFMVSLHAIVAIFFF